MKMKNMLIIAAAGLLTASAAKAEHQWDWSTKDRFHYETDTKEIFAPQEFTIDLAGAYGVGKEKFNDTFDRSMRQDEGGSSGKWGASVGVNYFITRCFGIGLDAHGLDNKNDFVDATSASAILRLPVGRLAPYVFGGAGKIFEGRDSWTAHVGAGLEVRLNARTGIFVDGRHIFLEKDNTSDFALLRSGLRFAF